MECCISGKIRYLVLTLHWKITHAENCLQLREILIAICRSHNQPSTTSAHQHKFVCSGTELPANLKLIWFSQWQVNNRMSRHTCVEGCKGAKIPLVDYYTNQWIFQLSGICKNFKVYRLQKSLQFIGLYTFSGYI